MREGYTTGRDRREWLVGPAQSENPRTLRNNMHENRETSGASRSNQDRDRSEKAISRTADRHAPEESDPAVVPVNLSNKEKQSSAEMGEGRARAKENIEVDPWAETQS